MVDLQDTPPRSPNMTFDLAHALADLGWTKNDLATLCDVHPNTVSNWGNNPPAIVAAYLTLLTTVKGRIERPTGNPRSTAAKNRKPPKRHQKS